MGRFRGAPATNMVDHHYFETLGLAIDSGRNFTPQEASNNAKVAIVSQATARKLWPEAQPLGQTPTIDETQHYQVIGVVPDVISGFLFEGKDPTAAYLPGALGQPEVDSIIARLHSTPAAIRTLCASHGSGCEPVPLREMADRQRMPFQVAASISAALGALSLLLTAIGLYSVASYSVTQRRREIGVHLALGATPANVVRRILRESIRSVAAGAAVGLPISLALSHWAASSVLRIETYDPLAYLAVPSLLAMITLLATALPARRAARTDPMVALREE
jgi:ABC-type antimicrobial peptide transport system permease subunit